jgi:membrane protease YdiL (CAAX protease family)
MKSLARKPVLLFLGLTLTFSVILYIPIIGMGMGIQGLLNLGIMWCPGLAAIITSLICYKSIKGLGWRWGKTRWQLLSYFLPFVYAGVVYGLVWVLGLGKLDFVALSNTGTGEGVSKLLYLATLGTCITALGEEIGWRGFLTQEMAKDMDWIHVSLYTGIIWILWHIPLILFSDYRTGAPIWFGLPCFAIMVMGTNFAYTWLRLKSGSLWTGVLLHGGHNFILYELDRLTLNTGTTSYFTNEYGIGLAVAGVIVGVIFWQLGDPLARNPKRNSHD